MREESVVFVVLRDCVNSVSSLGVRNPSLEDSGEAILEAPTGVATREPFIGDVILAASRVGEILAASRVGEILAASAGETPRPTPMDAIPRFTSIGADPRCGVACARFESTKGWLDGRGKL